MRVLVTPSQIQLDDSQTFTVTITVTNTGSVIGGYHLRVLGADPAWVSLEAENLSLFPETSQTVSASVSIPRGVAAGDRRIAVQVQETTPPQSISVTEIELLVPPRESLTLALSPMTTTCGKHGRFSVVAENTGNTAMTVSPIGMDAEDAVSFEFRPSTLHLSPGERVITDLRTTAKRRWFGSPVVRPFSLSAVPPEQVAAAEQAAADQAAAAKRAKAEDKARRKNARREQRQEQKRAERDAKRLTQGGEPLPPSGSGASEAAPESVDPQLSGSELPPESPDPLAQGVMMQKPRLGRGVLSLMSLLLAVSVFAVVITIAMSRLVGVSAADRDLAIQVASARTSGAGTGTSVLGGTVTQLTDDSPVNGATVELYEAGDLTHPMISTASGEDGAWSVATMPAGKYKIRFLRAGYAQLWYPDAATGDDAKEVALKNHQQRTDLAVTLAGLPATISGVVNGDDVAGATLSVVVPDEYLSGNDSAGSSLADDAEREGDQAGDADLSSGTSPPTITAQPVQPGDDAASSADARGNDDTASDEHSAGDSDADNQPGGVLRTIPIGSDGTFSLEDLPSPAVYNLVVAKSGYATTTQRVDLAGGESRDGITLTLRTGDGMISGVITDQEGGVGGAVITAVSGDTTVTTVSLTEDDHVGEFALRGLMTPANYTITVTEPDHTTVTSTLSLTAEQRLGDVRLSLAKASGSLSGMVTTLADGKPAAGVAVTIATGSSDALTTVTQSGSTKGQWSAAGLAIPGTYTITFSRDDLQSQTVSVAVNAAGKVTSGADADGAIDVAMTSAFATVTGTVVQRGSEGTTPVSEATITLASGEHTYTVTSASTPSDSVGKYAIGHVAPGTYTLSVSSKGTSPTTVIMTVTAGEKQRYDPVLVPPASISGTVTQAGAPVPNIEVDLYLSDEYPAKIYAQTTTDETGHYTFADVDAPRAYVVEARNDESGSLVSRTVVIDASQAQTLDLTVPPAGNATSGDTP